MNKNQDINKDNINNISTNKGLNENNNSDMNNENKGKITVNKK